MLRKVEQSVKIQSLLACRPDGETGRHKGLKIPRLNGCAGSIPAPGTKSKNQLKSWFFHFSLTNYPFEVQRL
jgi:hypothetical protein